MDDHLSKKLGSLTNSRYNSLIVNLTSIYSMSEHKAIVARLCAEKYKDARVIYWAGSVTTGNYTSNSDLDLVIIFDDIPNAYREAFVYEGWKIDAFIHDFATLRYFFEEIDRKSGMSVLPQMVVSGVLITPSSPLSEDIKQLATKIIDKGPPPWSKEEIDRTRFFITDLLDDIVSARNRTEQVASTAKLYETLAEFYFRAQNKWQADGKAIIQYLKKENYDLAETYRDAFDEVFKRNHTQQLEVLVKKILEPYGGLLWEGYRADAPTEWKK